MKYSTFLIFLIVLCSCQVKDDTPKIIELSENWYFKNVEDTNWSQGSVPGNVHSDLLNNGLIEHPFIKDNEFKLQWISESDWEYKTTFKVDDQLIEKNNIELSFQGLDTYASVFLNDSLLLKTNNAFRSYRVDVKSLLQVENEIYVIFDRTSIIEEQEKNNLNYSLPEGNRIFTRKAQFQYGWDWGPQLNTFGIWRPINLEAWNDLKIRDVFVNQKSLNDSIANLVAEIDIDPNTSRNLKGDIFVNNSLVQTINIDSIKSSVEIPFQISNPKRWWPHNIGEPYLYEVRVVLRNDNSKLDSISQRVGLRTIDLVTEKDSLGETFYFKVNDVPVYAKGANYIPQNSMQNQVTDGHYEHLLNDVIDANMNMLRVWGGGIYENDIFYDLCDQKGILVWQDFMFACAMYPGDKAFLNNVQMEAIDNVKRLRNHASIALWCGNNENSEGWHRWGWQTNRTEAEKEEIWSNYLHVFDSILPNTVARLSNSNYWESSPKYGRGNPKYQYEGDAHDWWVWHDAYPFEHLEENVPRFMSEFGFQSLPSYETIAYINKSDSIDISSKEFITHQKHTRGFQLIREYMERDYPVPNNAEDYVYVSQLLQAFGITKGIEAQRRAKPFNMGTLYWQLNDCWPVVSWSSIDFLGNWKALHYKAKRSFQDVLISSEFENNVMRVFIVNDEFKQYSGNFKIRIIDFDGKELLKDSIDIIVEKNSSAVKYELDTDDLQLNKEEVVIIASFKNKESIIFLERPKNLRLKQGPIQQTISKVANGFQIELKSKTLQKDVFLFCNVKGRFSDNYIDLLPNKSKTIFFETESKSLDDLKTKTLNGILTTP